MIKVVIVDDHPPIREGIATIFKDIEGIEIIGKVDNAPALLVISETQAIDIVLLDLSMPDMEEDGFGIFATIKNELPSSTKVLIYSMHNEAKYLRKAHRKGAAGYVFKSADFKELEMAIRMVARGESYFNQEAENILKESGLANEEENHFGFYLTEREKELLRYISRGHEKDAIIKAMGCASATIDKHRKNMLKKAKNDLDIHTIAGVVAYVIEYGLLDE